MSTEVHKKSRGKNPRIALIGRRNGAIAAARKLGLEPIVIDVRARREQSAMAYGGTSDWALAHALEESAGQPLVGALAVATGSVMAAAAIRDHFHLPGISSATALRCHDKLVMKKALVASGIPCAPWHETTPASTPRELIDLLDLPLVLKLPISSGGRGVWICRNEAEVSEHLRSGLLAEGFVEGVEMSVETFRAASTTIFRNHTHYLIPRFSNVVPASLPKKRLEEIHTLAETVHETLEIATGITHMEIFLTPHGAVFGEIAARPPGGYLMKLIRRAYQFDPWEALLRIELGETPQLPQKAVRHAGVSLLHPGEGIVSRVEGISETLQIPGIREVVCHPKLGDHLEARIGSGESLGRILAEGKSYHECVKSLQLASQTLVISLEKRGDH